LTLAPTYNVVVSSTPVVRKGARLALLGLGVCLAVSGAGQPDFRKATWGMTRAQVLATEAAQPSEVRESNGEVLVRYDSLELGKLACRVVYIFANDKLVRAKYVFDAKHSDPNEFIRVSERAFWSDDSLQDEPKSYLEQDRASSTDILPSDQYAGLSIAAGHLKLYTRWRGDRTQISHGLTAGSTGEDSRISHQVEFLSVELEKLETETRGISERN
jgi:hypothetical protein